MVNALFPSCVNCVRFALRDGNWWYFQSVFIHLFVHLNAWHLLFLLIAHRFVSVSNNWQSAVSFSLSLFLRLCWLCVRLRARLCMHVPGRRRPHYTVLTGDEDFDNFRKKPFSDKHHHQFYVRSIIHFIDFRDSAAAFAVLLMASSAKTMRRWNVYAVRVRLRVSLCGNKWRWKSIGGTHLLHLLHRLYLVSQPVNDAK